VTEESAKTGDKAPQEKTLDELLTDFEDPKPEGQTPEAKPKPDEGKLDKVVNWMESQQQEQVSKAFEDGIADAIKNLKCDEIKASDRAIKGMLYTLAEDNPKFEKAFQSRRTNPAAWERSLEWAKAEMIKEYPASTDKLVENIEAAKASASSQTKTETKKLDNEFWNSLSDVQFRVAKSALAAGKDPKIAVSKRE